MATVSLGQGFWRALLARCESWIGRPLPWMVVLLLGLGARSYQYLGNPSYWYDEADLTLSIYRFSALELLGPLPGRTIIPPVFLWLLRGCYLTFGPQEWALRLPAFVAGIVGLGLMIPLARRWLGSPGWLWAVGFCALSTHCLNHTVEVRAYTTDFALTVAILLVGHAYLHALSPRTRLGWGSSLLLAAALAPWMSFTSAFVLAAVSAALLVTYLARRTRAGLTFWLAFNGLLLATSLLVWYVQARHLYYPGLKDEWTAYAGFPGDYSPWTLAAWTSGALKTVPEYASTGLGLPLLLLALLGMVRCGRRSKAEIVLLVGPVLVTYGAGLAGKYPFADRAILFLAPCVWLLAVEGLLFLVERLPAVAARGVALLVLGVMLPGLLNTAWHCVRLEPMMEYREALVYVHDRCPRQEAVWNWCARLGMVYFDHVFPGQNDDGRNGPQSPGEAIAVVRTRPLWVIAPDCRLEEMTQSLRALPVRQTLCEHFKDVQVVRFEPIR